MLKTEKNYLNCHFHLDQQLFFQNLPLHLRDWLMVVEKAKAVDEEVPTTAEDKVTVMIVGRVNGEPPPLTPPHHHHPLHHQGHLHPLPWFHFLLHHHLLLDCKLLLCGYILKQYDHPLSHHHILFLFLLLPFLILLPLFLLSLLLLSLFLHHCFHCHLPHLYFICHPIMFSMGGSFVVRIAWYTGSKGRLCDPFPYTDWGNADGIHCCNTVISQRPLLFHKCHNTVTRSER